MTLKQAAEKNGCAQTTLKRWVKNNDIEFTKNASKAYLVDPHEVEAKLRSSPKVASIYHPKSKVEPTTGSGVQNAQPMSCKVEQGAALAPAPAAKVKLDRSKSTKGKPELHSKAQQAATAKKSPKHRLPDLEWTYRGVQKLGVEDLVKLRNRINSLLNGFN